MSGINFSYRSNEDENLRGFALGLVLGLSIAIAGVGLAQNVSQTDANKKMESCCCMSSGCCGDSCAMKDGAMKMAPPHRTSTNAAAVVAIHAT